MTAHETELAELQRRVFGPDADPVGDPDAVRRLAELQAARRAAAAEVAGARVDAVQEEPAAPVVPAPTAAAPGADGTGGASDGDPASAMPPAERRFPLARSSQLLWVGTLVAALWAAGVVSLTPSRTVYVDLEGGAEVVATLAPDDSVEPLVEGMRGYEEFEGLQPLLPGARWAPGRGCLWVVEKSGISRDGNSWSISGMSVEGCGAGPFPSAVAFTIDENASDQLRAAYPEGTAFRMVHVPEDDRVVVFRAAAPSGDGTAGAADR